MRLPLIFSVFVFIYFAVPAVAQPNDETEASDEKNEEEEPAFQVPSRLKSPPFATAKPLSPEQDMVGMAHRDAQGRLLTKRGEVDEVLTIDAGLQSKLKDILRSYQTPYAAVVALEPSSGRVLAMVEHSEADPSMRGLCTKAIFPAASIFKIITAAALLEAGLSPDTSECFHGGKRQLSEKLLVDSERDSRCYAMSTALAMSANVVFAKLTMKHLSAEKLLAAARAFHFNREFLFPIPTEISLAAIPESDIGLSSAGAGFGDVFLSPLHGAAIASVAANKGLWRDPILLESDAAKEVEPERVISEQNASALADMLEQTVIAGTARRIFRQRGFQVEHAVGKTGSLADRRPFRDYSWFVGFAPKDDPRVAVAAVVVNNLRWRIRATWIAREAMRLYLERQKQAHGRSKLRVSH